MDEAARHIRDLVYEKLDLSRQLSDEEIYDLVELEISRFGKRKALTLKEREDYRMEIFNSLRKLDVLQELVEDDSVTEIMVNGTQNIFYEQGGRIYQWNKNFSSKEKLEDVIQQIVSENNRVVNEASPIVDTRLPNGARVNVVLAPVALEGPVLSIRKFPTNPITMKGLIERGSLSTEIAAWLEKLVKAGYNMFISGGTGSGKTTFLNALAEYIPKEERLVTIEDSAELQIKGIPNLVRLETRNANQEGATAIEIRDLIRTSLRMRPDRVIVGECRGKEAIDMLQAMNTGHDGSLSTGHANSCKDMISRLETMVLMGEVELPLAAIRAQIASGIDLLVHLGRLRDKTRKLLDIVEVVGMENGEVKLNPIFTFMETGEKAGKIKGEWVKVGELIHKEKLIGAGL